MRFWLAATLTLLVLILPARAQEAPLPEEVQSAIDEIKKDCGERVRLKPHFVTTKDVNGDGKPDYILDYEKFGCGNEVTPFCGSAGCLTQVLASLPGGSYVKAWDENVRAIRFARIKGKPAMILDLHGSACGKVGAARCAKTFLWNGRTFTGPP